MWVIWTSRNSLLFEQKYRNPDEVVEKSIALMKEFPKACQEIFILAPTERVREHQQWMKPPPGRLKVSVGGANNSNGVVAGVVIRGHSGEVMVSMANRLEGIKGATQVEIMAI